MMISWDWSLSTAIFAYLVSIAVIMSGRAIFKVIHWRQLRYLLWSLCPVLLLTSQLKFEHWQTFVVTPDQQPELLNLAKYRIEQWSNMSLVILAWAIGFAIKAALIVLQYIKIARSIEIVAEQSDFELSTVLKTPAVFGFIRPQILLPKDIATQRLDADQLALILKHEKQHIKHGDPLWNFVSLCLDCLFWFVPGQSKILRLFKHDQELMCDHAVTQKISSKEKTRYAQLILNYANHTPQLAAAVQWHAYPLIKERLTMINHSKKPAWLAAIILAVVAASGIAVASIETAKQEAKVIKHVNPLFPRQAVEKGISGWVKVKGITDNNGYVRNLEVVNSSPKGVFDKEALNAVMQWQFDKKNTEFQYQIDFNVEP